MTELEMIKEYCKRSIDGELLKIDSSQSDMKVRLGMVVAYREVIEFIKEHELKCSECEIENSFSEVQHEKNQSQWFESRMKDYRKSFWKVCELIEHSDCSQIIKDIVKDELNRY